MLYEVITVARKWLDMFCHVIALGVTALLAWYSIQLVMQSHSFNDISTGLDATPLWIPQLGMAIGSTVFTLAFAVDLVDLISGRKIVEAPKEGVV